ncbi:MAG: hypothetical protein ABIR84_03215 [Candidatus Nitrotoga sp.]
MPKINLVAFLLLSCLPLLAMSGTSDTMKLTGRLVYSAGGNDINMIELNSLKQFSLGSFSTDSSINHFTRLSDSIFLFENCNGRRKPNCLLKEFVIGAKTPNTLRSGYSPTYIPENKSLLFYDQDEESGQMWLHIADVRSPSTSHKVAKAPADMILSNGLPYPIITQPLQISSDEVIFVGEDKRLWRVQVSSSKLTPTIIKNCIPQIWRDRSQRLVCYDWESQEFYQTTLMAGNIEKLPQLKGAYGLVYLPKDDVIIYGKARLKMLVSETYDIFAYSFNTNKHVKVRANSHINSGVWLP